MRIYDVCIHWSTIFHPLHINMMDAYIKTRLVLLWAVTFIENMMSRCARHVTHHHHHFHAGYSILLYFNQIEIKEAHAHLSSCVVLWGRGAFAHFVYSFKKQSDFPSCRDFPAYFYNLTVGTHFLPLPSWIVLLIIIIHNVFPTRNLIFVYKLS